MTISKFISSQISQINDGGTMIIFHKLIRFVKLSPILIFALVILILIRTISFIFVIKLIPVDFARIGGVYHLLWYAKLKKINEKTTHQSINLFFSNNSTTHVNLHWFKMWKRSLIVLPFSSIWKYTIIINKFFPGYEKFQKTEYIALLNPYYAKKNKALINSLKDDVFDKLINIKESVVNLKKKDTNICKNYLQKIGTSDYNFVCFHARDSFFLNKYNKNNRDWSYHDFRDSNIESYFPAIEEMSNKNILFFRMGLGTKNKLKYSNSKVIDYANSSDRSDLLDIYLSSKCFFFIGSESGITILPETFNRPIVYLNWPGIDNTQAFANNSIFIPRKFYSNKYNRFLTFKEVMELNFHDKFNSAYLRKLNIKLIDNTSQEIVEAVLEIHSRLTGKWQLNKEDEDLQNKFWSLFKYKFLKSPTFRIGCSFLRNNQSLLN